MPESIYWREPLWLWLMLLPLVLVFIGKFFQKRFWLQIADAELLPWLQTTSTNSASRFPQLLFVISWLLFMLALSGPRTPDYIPPEALPQQEKAVIIVDYSSSMQTMDATAGGKNTSRIKAAQQLLQHWSKELPDRLQVGIIIFAGHAFWILKPTADFHLLEHHINQLDQFMPPTLGNELSGAFKLAEQELSNKQQAKHLLLITDGDIDTTHRNKAAFSLSELIEKTDVNLKVIGFGGIEASRIPDGLKRPLIIDNRPATSRLESQWLKQLASNANSQYLKSDAAFKDSLKKLLNLQASRIQPENFSDVIWHEWFALPLLLGIILFLVALQFTKTGEES